MGRNIQKASNFLDAFIWTNVSLGTGYSLTHWLTDSLTDTSKREYLLEWIDWKKGQRDKETKKERNKGTKGQWDNGTMEQWSTSPHFGLFFTKWWSYSVEGLFSTGPTPSSFSLCFFIWVNKGKSLDWNYHWQPWILSAIRFCPVESYSFNGPQDSSKSFSCTLCGKELPNTKKRNRDFAECQVMQFCSIISIFMYFVSKTLPKLSPCLYHTLGTMLLDCTMIHSHSRSTECILGVSLPSWACSVRGAYQNSKISLYFVDLVLRMVTTA